MKKVFFIFLLGCLSCNQNSSNDDLPTVREINDIADKHNEIEKNKSSESGDIDMDKACQCYEDMYEQHKELYEMSDSERRENEYKWNRISGKARVIECNSALKNLRKKYGDECQDVLEKNCQAARDVEMMRQKLRNFYD